MKQLLKKYYPAVILLLVLLLPIIVFAQGGPPDPNDVPIDGGISVLLAAGAAYGVKKYRDHKKNGKEL